MPLLCVDQQSLINLEAAVNNQQIQWSLLLQQLNILQRHILERVPLIPCPCVGACTQEDPIATAIIDNLLQIANNNVFQFNQERSETADATTILDNKLDQCLVPELP